MLTEIRVEKFDRINNTSIRFDGLLTVIFGADGTGKTTLLQALRFIASTEDYPPQFCDAIVTVTTEKHRYARHGNSEWHLRALGDDDRLVAREEFARLISPELRFFFVGADTEQHNSIITSTKSHFLFAAHVLAHAESCSNLFGSSWFVDGCDAEHELSVRQSSRSEYLMLKKKYEFAQEALSSEMRTLRSLRLKRRAFDATSTERLTQLQTELVERQVTFFNSLEKALNEVPGSEELSAKADQALNRQLMLEQELSSVDVQVAKLITMKHQLIAKLTRSPKCFFVVRINRSAQRRFVTALRAAVLDGCDASTSDADSMETPRRMILAHISEIEFIRNRVADVYGRCTTQISRYDQMAVRETSRLVRSTHCRETLDDALNDVCTSMENLSLPLGSILLCLQRLSPLIVGAVDEEAAASGNWLHALRLVASHMPTYYLIVKNTADIEPCRDAVSHALPTLEPLLRSHCANRRIQIISIEDSSHYSEFELPQPLCDLYRSAAWLSEHVCAKNPECTNAVRFAYRRILCVSRFNTDDSAKFENLGVTAVLPDLTMRGYNINPLGLEAEGTNNDDDDDDDDDNEEEEEEEEEEDASATEKTEHLALHKHKKQLRYALASVKDRLGYDISISNAQERSSALKTLSEPLKIMQDKIESYRDDFRKKMGSLVRELQSQRFRREGIRTQRNGTVTQTHSNERSQYIHESIFTLEEVGIAPHEAVREAHWWEDLNRQLTELVIKRSELQFEARECDLDAIYHSRANSAILREKLWLEEKLKQVKSELASLNIIHSSSSPSPSSSPSLSSSSSSSSSSPLPSSSTRNTRKTLAAQEAAISRLRQDIADYTKLIPRSSDLKRLEKALTISRHRYKQAQKRASDLAPRQQNALVPLRAVQMCEYERARRVAEKFIPLLEEVWSELVTDLHGANSSRPRIYFSVQDDADYTVRTELRVQLGGGSPRRVSELSSGEQVVLMLSLDISLALCTRGAVLVLDDAAARLDRAAQDALAPSIRRVLVRARDFAQQIPPQVVMATSRGDAARFGDTAVTSFIDLRSPRLRNVSFIYFQNPRVVIIYRREASKAGDGDGAPSGFTILTEPVEVRIPIMSEVPELAPPPTAPTPPLSSRVPLEE